MGDFFQQNWGNLASVLGLSISVCVLLVAQKAREAAEQARSLARLKSLVEELESAANSVQLIGVLLKDRKWDVVHFLADEALSVCQASLTRWGDQLMESKSGLYNACTELRSISDSCVASVARTLSDEDWLGTIRAQREARVLISSALGHVRKAEERSTRSNARKQG